MWGGFDKAATSVFPPCFPALYKWSRKCPNEEHRWESHYVSWGSHYHCMWGEVLYLWVTWREKHSQLITALRASSTADWSLTNPWRSWISEPPPPLLEPVCKWGKSVNEASLWPLFYYVHLIMDLGYLWKRERKSFIVHCSPSRPLAVPLCSFSRRQYEVADSTKDLHLNKSLMSIIHLFVCLETDYFNLSLINIGLFQKRLSKSLKKTDCCIESRTLNLS